MSRPEEDGFLSRWSKRKRADPEEETPEVEAAPEQELEDRSDEEILEDLGLPDPDELKEGDDFSGFMNGAVPTRLRNRALRKLWLSNPVLANLDEMVDYGEDFTDAATVVENLQTAYQVGKGWLPDATDDESEDDVEAAEPGDSAEDEEESDEIAAAEVDTFPQDEKIVAPTLKPETQHAAVVSPEEPGPVPQPDAVEVADIVASAPRRMRFRFENG